MKTVVGITMALLVTSVAVNAQYVRAIEKAKQANSQVNQRQNEALNEGSNSAAQPGAAKPANPQQPATTAPAAAPIKPSTQQQAATKLKADITEAHTKGEVTAEMKKQFATDLGAAAMGSYRPSPAALAKLSDALLPAVAAKNVSHADDAKLVKAIVVSLNSAGLSSSRLQELNDEVQGVLTKAGVPAGDAAVIGQNLAAAVGEIQTSAGK